MHANKLWIPVVFVIILAVGVAASLSALNEHTSTRIDANLRAWEMRQIQELLPAGSYDNDLFDELFWVNANDPDAQLLGRGERHYICKAKFGGEARAAILQVTASGGYSGPIDLMIAVYMDGSLAGVRVTQHRETPGLGDLIEAEKSDWIHQFAGARYTEDQEQRWQVKKDGGDFDQITGATVSPRAVVSAVKDALIFFERNRETIFASEPQSESQSPL